MKIDDFLSEYHPEWDLLDFNGENPYSKYQVKQMSKDLLRITSKVAKTKKVGNSGSWLDAGVDKQSILNILEDE